MSEVRLTAEEREQFENNLRWHFNVVAEEGKGSSFISLGVMNATLAVEAILAARLAAVEAAITEHAFEFRGDPGYLVVDVEPIRAALTPGTTAAGGAGAGGGEDG